MDESRSESGVYCALLNAAKRADAWQSKRTVPRTGLQQRRDGERRDAAVRVADQALHVDVAVRDRHWVSHRDAVQRTHRREAQHRLAAA